MLGQSRRVDIRWYSTKNPIYEPRFADHPKECMRLLQIDKGKLKELISNFFSLVSTSLFGDAS